MDKEVIVNRPECRVLQVFGNLGTGGAETWLIAFLKYVRRNSESLPVKLTVHVFLTNGVKSDFDEEAESLGAILHYSKYTRSNILGFFLDWRRILREFRFHVIHDHQENTAGWHFLMGLGYLPKLRIIHLHNPVLHLKNYSSSNLRAFTVKTGQYLIAKLGTHILGTSQQLIGEQGYFSSIFSSLVREPLYCGFDVSQFSGNHLKEVEVLRQELGWSADSKIMLFVGRLNSDAAQSNNQKNPDFALEIARACALKDKSFRFLMVGGGEPVLGDLRERVRRWGLDNVIKLVGQRKDVPRCMLGSHLFILTSYAEGLGMVVVEAQAAGLRCLVSDATPRECMVVESAVQFMPLDAGVEAWARLCLQIMKQPRVDSSFGNLLVRSSDFSIENSATKLLEYYTSGFNLGVSA